MELDQSDLATIGQALNELPKRIADPMILKINSQLQNQAMVTPKAVEPKDSKKKK